MENGTEDDKSKREEWPAKYCSQTERELLLLDCTEIFRRRHQEQRTARKPLLLVPRNECNLPKMVCTSLRPTGFSEPELFLSWQGAAQFVADHVRYLPLENPLTLPEKLRSPGSVLHAQEANCFELSLLLASVLIGAWYDAYVVSGYACRELCQGDQTYEDCPPWPEELPPVVAEVKEDTGEVPKYQVKLDQHFESQYLKEREIKKQLRLKEEADKKKEEERKAMEAEERRDPDQFHGLRIHSWVLVRPGTRGVEHPFFIDPATGNGCSPEDDRFLGLESLWNHENYWVSLQGPALPAAGDYDLEDKRAWEALRPGAEVSVEQAGSKPRFLLLTRQLDMPPSWSQPLLLSHTAFERRFPGGSKVQLYRAAQLRQWGPYLRPDGLVAELTRYTDHKRQEELWVLQRYHHREDCLAYRVTHVPTKAVTESFLHTRPDFLTEHRYIQGRELLEQSCSMKFNHNVHLDNLQEVELEPLEMTEHYEGRDDFLYLRHVTYAPAQVEDQPRVVLNITEKYHRNKEKPAVEDIAIRTFAVSENTISLTYHMAEDNFTANWRTFKKPPGYMFGERFRFEPHMTRGYQADPRTSAPRQLQLFRLMEQQLAAEDRALFLLRSRQAEVAVILQSRESEGLSPKLKISCFDVHRNEEGREAVKLQEQQAAERERQVQAEGDYKELFIPDYQIPTIVDEDFYKMPAQLMVRQRADLLRVHLPEPRDPEQTRAAHQACLADFKQLLQRRERGLELRVRKASDNLRTLQKKLESVRDELSSQEVDEYLDRVDAASFHVRCVQLLLKRHRQLTPQRVAALQKHLQAALPPV